MILCGSSSDHTCGPSTSTSTSKYPSTLWILGAWLLGVTVLKMLVIDMHNTGGVARVFAFIPVGILIVIIGYFAPIPPSATSDAAENIDTTEKA